MKINSLFKSYSAKLIVSPFYFICSGDCWTELPNDEVSDASASLSTGYIDDAQ